jgi:peptidylprolyl isomerase
MNQQTLFRPFIARSLYVCALVAMPLAAQTSAAPAPTPTAQHSSTASSAAHHAAAHTAGCAVHPPEISPAIPPLPSSAVCVKTLYTVTRTAMTKLDYVSPLVSPEVRDALSGGPATYSLDYVDLQVGTGAPVAAHKYLSVKYTGYLATDGKKFDASDDHPNKEPINFEYGGHRVIPGWDTGFEGMHVGGKRRLYIPYELAYGENGRPPVIPPKSELIFDMEVVGQSDTPPPPPQRAPMPGGPRPGMPLHPPGANAPAGNAPGTPPAGNPPSSGTPTQPQSATPPAGNPPTGTAATPQPHN